MKLGDGKCECKSWETIAGPRVWVLVLMMGGQMDEVNGRCAEAQEGGRKQGQGQCRTAVKKEDYDSTKNSTKTSEKNRSSIWIYLKNLVP